MADKTKTIKSATDKELDELFIRLRKENDVQNLVSELKRKSTVNGPFGNSISYDRPEVSTEAPIESLYHNADDVLAHFGILGMHWGVRRGRKQTSPGKKSRNESSEDYVNAKELKRKGAKALSTKELKEVTARLQLEKQYKDLTKKDLSVGMKWVKDVVGGAVKEQAKSQLSKYIGKGLEEAVRRAAR